MPARKSGAAKAFRRTGFICRVIRVPTCLPAIRTLSYGFRGRCVQSLFLFVQIAVHHKEQGGAAKVGGVRRLHIGTMFPQAETAAAVEADAPCGNVGCGRLHFQHDGLSGLPDEGIEDTPSQSAAAQWGQVAKCSP